MNDKKIRTPKEGQYSVYTIMWKKFQMFNESIKRIKGWFKVVAISTGKPYEPDILTVPWRSVGNRIRWHFTCNLNLDT